MHWNNIPVLAQTLKMSTSEGAMKSYSDRAAQSEKKPNVLASSAFGGFPMADIPEAGMSVVMITDDDQELAKTECNAILNVAWEQKEAFIWKDEPLEDSIRHAKSLKEGANTPARSPRQLRYWSHTRHHDNPARSAKAGSK